MTAFDFIFMLTRNDRTVPGAADCLEIALAAGVRHIGFKDVGLPVAELKGLGQRIRAAEATSYLEVVSLDAASELASARAALDIGVDVLLGGTRAEAVLPLIAGSGLRYMPFAGRVSGHPSVLEGTLDEIVASAVSLCRHAGVHGVDLLAYRWPGDVGALMAAVCAAVSKPVIMAGSIDTPARIAAARQAGARGFTIGTAAIDAAFADGDPSLAAQLSAIRAAVVGLAAPGGD